MSDVNFEQTTPKSSSSLKPIIVALGIFVLVSVSAYAGFWYGKQQVPPPAPTPKVTTPPVTEVPEATPPAEVDEAVTESQIGYIKSIFEKNGLKYLTVDYIQWLSESKGGCRSTMENQPNIPQCNPNGYLIVNNNPQIRTFEIADSVVIDFSDFKTVGLAWKDNQQLTSSYLTLNEFQEIFLGKNNSINWLKDAVYHIEIKKNIITKIRYQYQP